MHKLTPLAYFLICGATAFAASAQPSFRQVGLEERCEALTNFVSVFARRHFPKGTYKEGGCGEGNGLGGARYTLDFKVQPKDKLAHPFRLDVAFPSGGDAVVRICDTMAKPVTCGDEVLSFTSMASHARDLVPAVTTWMQNKGKGTTRIYGMNYSDFLKDILAYKGNFPVSKGEKDSSVSFHLEPADAKDPSSGKVVFEGAVDSDFLQCFKCTDVKCLNDSVRYKFEDRFFALTREVPGEKGEPSQEYGAGWIIQGPKPMATPQNTWKYACGVSRYSLQNVKL